MKCLLIHNLKAGDGGEILRPVRRSIENVGYAVSAIDRARKDLIRKELKRMPDIVAVLGGDGTVATLLDFLPDLSMPVLLLPSGTANNIAVSLGLPPDPLRAVDALRSNIVRRFDIGAVAGPFGARNFVETVGFGVFATTLDLEIEGRDAEERLRKAREAIASALASHSPKRAVISIDGEVLNDDWFLFVEVTGIGRVGPSLPLVDDVQLDDGLVDVVTLAPDRRDDMVRWLRNQEGRPPVQSRRGRRIVVESADQLRIDDGAVAMHGSPIRLEVSTGQDGLTIAHL